MRSLTTLAVLLVLSAPSGLVAQTQPSATKTDTSASSGATKAEVDELRSELAAQRQTIEQLKALVEKLAQQNVSSVAVKPVSDSPAPTQAVLSAQPAQPQTQATLQNVDTTALGSAHLADAVLRQPDLMQAMVDPSAPATKKDVPLTAGWNGEHFFIRSADGQFTLSPYGYVNMDYRAYTGSGAPADTFLLRRARFGFQGSYGSHFDFALLADAAATTGSTIRDVYLNIRVRPEFQFQAGQFKVPFGQETGMGVTNLDFIERGFQSLLAPSAASAYRSPGMVLHGDLYGGTVQWFAGAFNGKGYALANTTNQPEIIGRLRFYPFRRSKSKEGWFKEFAFGGAVDFARSRALSGDTSFSGAIPDGAYSFFPQFPINGDIERYNGEFTYLHNSFALRGEYAQLAMYRTNIGSYQVGNLGYLSLPGIRAKAWDIDATYLLTGEKRPENGTPRVKHPLFGPDTPGGSGRGLGAWEVAVRYTGVQAIEPGSNYLNFYTPGFVPTFDYHTDEITLGLNWYPNYWVRYMVNLGIDRLKDPSTIGAEPQNYYVVMQRLQFRF
jgi:phosphate-selective porin OprO and OprP